MCTGLRMSRLQTAGVAYSRENDVRISQQFEQLRRTGTKLMMS